MSPIVPDCPAPSTCTPTLCYRFADVDDLDLFRSQSTRGDDVRPYGPAVAVGTKCSYAIGRHLLRAQENVVRCVGEERVLRIGSITLLVMTHRIGKDLPRAHVS